MSRRSLSVVLWAGFVAVVVGGVAAVKSDGASAKTIPMVALFSDRAGDKITGDGGGFYVHQGTTLDANNVSIGNTGDFVMVVRASSGRYVDLKFDTRTAFPVAENPSECALAYFLDTPAIPVQSAYWALRTYWKCRYIPHEDETGKWTELIRSTTRRDSTILNLTTMKLNETVGVSIEMMRFRAPDNPMTPSYDEYQDFYGLTSQVQPGEAGSAIYLLVTATDWNGDGVMDWILRSIPGRVVIKEWDRTCELACGDSFSMGADWPCKYGSFGMPFELKIAKK